ncbi:MAG: DUF4340 domain-containing protein [Firmicutes bacterium]|jgi:hypothetical protein|nr:DUF4340 domain-containing protein [Bacillota bacterium]MDH7496674.1 DUF4340 domain-containing protein [Bacillota bacterium]
MRKFASTYIAVAVVVALGAYILFVEGVRTPGEDAGKILVDVAADEVTRVTVERASGRVEVARGEAHGKAEWRIESPKAVAASDDAVRALVNAAAKLTCEKRITDQAGDGELETFGFDHPWLKITLHMKEGEKAILLGGETPVGGARYVKLADSGAIYTVASSTVSALNKRFEDLRERNVVPVQSGSVTALRLVKPEGLDVRLERVQGEEAGEEEWRITQPFNDVADKWKVSDLVWDLTGLSVSEFVDDEGRDLERWGLERPRLRVEVLSTERDSVFELLVGSEAPDDMGFYVRTSDSPSVYLVNPAAFAPLETGAVDLVKKELLSWNDDDVLRVTCVDQGRAVAFLRDGKGWKTVPPNLDAAKATLIQGQPATKPAEVVKEGVKWELKAGEKRYSEDEMSALLAALRDVTVASVVEGSVAGTADARYGLDRPRTSVELDLGDGNVLELKIGRKMDRGEALHATATGRNLVYVVEEEKVKALQSAIGRFLQ